MSCCRSNSICEPRMTVYQGSSCNNYAHVENNGGCCCCPIRPLPICDGCNLCDQQIKFILGELISLYPTSIFTVTLEDGSTATGTPNSLFTDINKGLLVLNVTEGGIIHQEYLNICKIAAIRIAAATYVPSMVYLPAPPTPVRCGCEESIRTLLSAGDVVVINTAGQALPQSTVLASQFCVVAMTTGTDLIFVASSNIEKIRIISNALRF